MTTASPEKISQATDSPEISLEDMPDFDEEIPCACDGSRCSDHDQHECPREVSQRLQLMPCGCAAFMCDPCAEAFRNIQRNIPRFLGIPLQVPVCAEHLRRVRQVIITPI